MSRLIVKNLPKSITSKQLENLFSSKGCITDLQFKYNKQGVFRQFAFVGYKTEEEAQEAKKFFNNTFVHTSKIQVDTCKSLGEKPQKLYPSKKEETFSKVKIDNDPTKKVTELKKTKKIENVDDQTKELLKEDSQFKEFLYVNTERKAKPIWADAADELQSEEEEPAFDSSDDDNDDQNASVKKDEILEDKHSNEVTNATVKTPKLPDKKDKIFDDQFTVKVKNLPYRCKKKHIKQFFKALKITSLRLPPKFKGFAYVKFKSERDWKQALIKNKGFLDGHQVEVSKYFRKEQNISKPHSHNQAENSKEKNEELIAETGRLFVRNLCYNISEEEIEERFKHFGPLAEVHVPIDFKTKKGYGYAFVSYMFAEHAVKAFTELDGTIFQGRCLHLIPANPEKKPEIDENETSFKKKKQADLKARSGNVSDWNILFLDMNAVADEVAAKYNIEKSKLLSGDSKESVAVRMALAETEMVMENRKFLIDNGVQLDAFSQPTTPRSKTMIVVKNLPSNTKSEEINEVFSKHGAISRVIMPPSGVVALVEYDNPTEAKIAFKRLAYSRFRCLPLYLEWAPMGAVKEKVEVETNTETNTSEISEQNNSKEESIKNEAEVTAEDSIEIPSHTTVFVKNINFCTTSERFEKHFKECGPIQYASISMKKDSKTGKTQSMGFGFVQFKTKDAAVYALKNLQSSKLDGHAIELKFANRATQSTSTAQRKYQVQNQKSAIILVRNIPFQSDKREVEALFKQFGDLKSVRLPRKLGESGQHRGFGFIEFFTKDNAQRAFDALCHSTHLLNRRLVLEWANPDSEDVDHLRKRTARDFDRGKPQKILKKSKLASDVALASTSYGREGVDEGD